MTSRLPYEAPATGAINLAPQIDEQAHLSNQLKHFLQSVKTKDILPSVSERHYRDIRIGTQVLTRLGMFYKIEQGQPFASKITAAHSTIKGQHSEEVYSLTRDQKHWLHRESGYPNARYQHLTQEEMLESMLDCTAEHETWELDLLQDYPLTPGKLAIALAKDLGKSAHYRKESDAYHGDFTTVDSSHDYAYISSRRISIEETRTPKLTYRKLAVQALVQIGRETDVMQEISLTDKSHTKTGALLDQDLRLTLSSHELQPAELETYAQNSEYALSNIALNALLNGYSDLEAQTFLRAA